MTKREFVKYLYQAWKSLGLDMPRGSVFMSVGNGKHLLTTVFAMASGKIPIEVG